MKTKQTYLLIGTVLSWAIGYLGADRFYKGDVALGVIKLITLGGFGVWWIIDAAIWTYNLGKSFDNK